MTDSTPTELEKSLEDVLGEQPTEASALQALAAAAGIVLTKETQYTSCPIFVRDLKEGNRQLIILDPASGHAHIFGLPADAAKEVGGKLISTDLKLATPGDVPPPPQG